ncbi:MAG: IS66 family transposase [Janthinobacterium lividum]
MRFHRRAGPTVVAPTRLQPAAQAVCYALGRWSALARFLDNGRIDLGNNPVERRSSQLPLDAK